MNCPPHGVSCVTPMLPSTVSDVATVAPESAVDAGESACAFVAEACRRGSKIPVFWRTKNWEASAALTVTFKS